MPVATSDGPVSRAVRGARNRWWFFGTIVLPACLIGAGGLWLANSLAQYRLEVPRLQADAQRAKDELTKTRADLAQSSNDLAQSSDDLAKTRAEKIDLETQVDDLKAQREKLLVAIASPDSPDAIDKVRAALKDLSPRQRAEALYERGLELARLGRLEPSTRFLEAAATEDPTYYQPRVALALQASSRKDLTQAEHWFLDAEHADPTSPFPVYDLMNLYFMEKKLDKAGFYADRLRAQPERPHSMDDLLLKVTAATAKAPR